MAELRRSSLDFYAAVRSLYQQSRAGAVRDAKADVVPTASLLALPARPDEQALLPRVPANNLAAGGQ
jgi:ABC-type transporter lipoprotein component MlaA